MDKIRSLQSESDYVEMSKEFTSERLRCERMITGKH